MTTNRPRSVAEYGVYINDEDMDEKVFVCQDEMLRAHPGCALERKITVGLDADAEHDVVYFVTWNVLE